MCRCTVFAQLTQKCVSFGDAALPSGRVSLHCRYLPVCHVSVTAIDTCVGISLPSLPKHCRDIGETSTQIAIVPTSISGEHISVFSGALSSPRRMGQVIYAPGNIGNQSNFPNRGEVSVQCHHVGSVPDFFNTAATVPAPRGGEAM